MTKRYCKEHEGKIHAGGGGTYCRFHQQELCKIITPHCYVCGKLLTTTGYPIKMLDVVLAWEEEFYLTLAKYTDDTKAHKEARRLILICVRELDNLKQRSEKPTTGWYRLLR